MQELKTAQEAARAAGEVIRRYFGGESGVRAKEGQQATYNLVSDADVEAERVIGELIRRAFPHDAILGEETHQADLAAPRLWVVDPRASPAPVRSGGILIEVDLVAVEVLQHHPGAERHRLRFTLEEHAALRRVARLVAEGVASAELFAAVADEAAQVLDVPRIVLARYEPPPLPIQLVHPGGRLPAANLRAFLELAAARDWNFVDL